MDDPAVAVPAAEEGAQRGFAGLRLGGVDGGVLHARGGECGDLRLETMTILCAAGGGSMPADMVFRAVGLPRGYYGCFEARSRSRFCQNRPPMYKGVSCYCMSNTTV